MLDKVYDDFVRHECVQHNFHLMLLTMRFCQ